MTGAWRLLGRAMALLLVWGSLAAAAGGAQEAGAGSLTISGAVCPVDYAGARFAEECAATPAAGASYQVRNIETGAMRPNEGGFAVADEAGIVAFDDLAGLAPGTIQILALAPDNVAVGGYTVPAVACAAARDPAIAVDLLDSEFAGQIVELEAQAGDDLRCNVFIVPYSLDGSDAPIPPAETPIPEAADAAPGGSWLDGPREGWNSPGMAIPAAPAPATPTAPPCQDRVRPVETDEDAAVAAQGWLLTSSYERGWGVTLVGASLGFDAQCRPVPYQRFVFVDGAFAGTLAPEPMLPRSDGALTDAGIAAAGRLYAAYDRYGPSDPLCCPSGETVVTFSIARTPDGPVVAPDGGSAAAAPAAAAAVAVCVGLGGDALSLAYWTVEEIAAAEARSGPVARPHPATAACADPAGLPVLRDALAAFSWVCLLTANGQWYGPVWTADIYLPADAVPPDPALGGCPRPRDASVPPRAASEQAAATAVYLSQLEAAGDLDALYAWLHPDAQAVVPREAVAGWYAADWLPRGPEPIAVTSVALGPWTWGVTGTTYPNAAEIAYEQKFADGSVASDVVRLAPDGQGVWRWFFGRDPAFVAAQIERFVGENAGG